MLLVFRSGQENPNELPAALRPGVTVEEVSAKPRRLQKLRPTRWKHHSCDSRAPWSGRADEGQKSLGERRIHLGGGADCSASSPSTWVSTGTDGRRRTQQGADRRRIGHGSCRDQKAASEAGLPETIELPSCDVVDEPMNTGGEARCFAQYMRIHALEASGGLTYAQMGRFQSAGERDDPAGTSDEAAAAKDDNGIEGIGFTRRSALADDGWSPRWSHPAS